jgi:hypothetical protein
MGTRKLVESGIAYRSEVPERNSPLVVQGLQIGDTSAVDLRFASVLPRSWRMSNPEILNLPVSLWF